MCFQSGEILQKQDLIHQKPSKLNLVPTWQITLRKVLTVQRYLKILDATTILKHSEFCFFSL